MPYLTAVAVVVNVFLASNAEFIALEAPQSCSHVGCSHNMKYRTAHLCFQRILDMPDP